MNKVMTEHVPGDRQLDAALLKCAQRAVSLGVSETVLVDRLREKFHTDATNNIVTINTQRCKMMTNPEAGP